MRSVCCFLFFVFISFVASAKPDLLLSKGGPHNFGIVVHNANYTLYRSAALGKSGLKDVADFLKVRKLPFPKTIIYMHVSGYEYSFLHPTLFAVEEYEARKAYGFEFYHSFDYDHPTYLSGTNPYEEKTDMNRKRRLSSLAQSYFNFQQDKEIVGDINAFYRILDLVLNTQEPLLFHCAGGRHRTGMIAMALRYLQGGGWRQGAYGGPDTTRLNRAQYEYYLHNEYLFRKENLAFIERWAKDPRFLEYEKRYKDKLNGTTNR